MVVVWRMRGFRPSTSGILWLQITPSANNPDLSGTFNSYGGNLIGFGVPLATFITDPGATTPDLVGTPGSPIDPKIGPLADNLGPMFTHALLAGSPAIDTADTTAAPSTDQRGFPRTGPTAGDKPGYWGL